MPSRPYATRLTGFVPGVEAIGAAADRSLRAGDRATGTRALIVVP